MAHQQPTSQNTTDCLDPFVTHTNKKNDNTDLYVSYLETKQQKQASQVYGMNILRITLSVN